MKSYRQRKREERKRASADAKEILLGKVRLLGLEVNTKYGRGTLIIAAPPRMCFVCNQSSGLIASEPFDVSLAEFDMGFEPI
jgi:hypothetical protein